MASQRRSDGKDSSRAVSDRALAQLQRALRTLSAGNRTLLRAQDEAELLHDMCRTIVEQGGYRIACVGYAQHDAARSIRWMASVGWEPVPDATWDETERGRITTGIAIRSGQAVIGRNLRTEPHYDSRRLVEAGFESTSAFPLIAHVPTPLSRQAVRAGFTPPPTPPMPRTPMLCSSTSSRVTRRSTAYRKSAPCAR